MHSTIPVDHSEMRNKVREHKGNDEALDDHEQHRPRRRCRIGRGGRVYATQLHPCIAEYGVPNQTRHESRDG
jgi:hypothetical protein